MATITKGEIANRILKILGINTRTASAKPEEVQDTLVAVEDWMLSNNGIGRRIGWAESSGEDPDPNDESGIPSWAHLGVIYSCAVVIAPYFEKIVTPSIVTTAGDGMQTITARTIEYQEVQYPNRQPRGTGNRTTYSNKYYRQSDRVQTFNDFLTDEGDDPITTDGSSDETTSN